MNIECLQQCNVLFSALISFDMLIKLVLYCRISVMYGYIFLQRIMEPIASTDNKCTCKASSKR